MRNRLGRGKANSIILSMVLFLFAAVAFGVTLASAQQHDATMGSVASTPSIVSYQGRVLSAGLAVNGTSFFKFAVVNAAGNTSYWSNDGSSSGGGQPSSSVPVVVSNGQFTVMLGDTSLSGMLSPFTPAVFIAPDRRLRIWFSPNALSFTQLAPDQQIASVPFALNAETLDGLHSTDFAATQHQHSSADISDTISASKIDASIARLNQIIPTVTNAGFITKTETDLLYAPLFHTHSGADIVSGTVAEPRIDPLIARLSQITATLTTQGFITQTLADGRYPVC